MHVYLGMSKVLGGLPDSLKARSVEEDPFKAAADLRGLLRGRVQSMLARAEEGCEGQTSDQPGVAGRDVI